MKLKYRITTLEMDNELMAVPMDKDKDFRGILRMNGTTAFILKELETERTEDELVKALLDEYDASEEEIRESVRLVIDELRKSGLLVE